MLYIHQSTCISPQQTFLHVDINTLHEAVNNTLKVIEPSYENIPSAILRRMNKSVRIAIGCALPLVSNSSSLDGYIMGTANGGMEDCIKFLNQIIQYDEGVLTPSNFVQSTPNAIAGQLGILTKNNGYNITHVHRGFAFEMAVIDAMMIAEEYPHNNYLLGGVDEISAYNYNIDFLSGYYKQEKITTSQLYKNNSTGSIAGEIAAMFLVNANKENAITSLSAIHTIHSNDEEEVKKQLAIFIKTHLPKSEKINLLISGENGDSRLLKYYTACETIVNTNAMIVRFKHLTGECATASAFAVWLANYIFQTQIIPEQLLKNNSTPQVIKNILIYNTYKGEQHSFILLNKA